MCERLRTLPWRYDGRVPFVAWWCRLVKDAAVDRLRTERRRAAREAPMLADIAAIEPEGADFEPIRLAVQRLSPRYRDVVVMHYYGQLSLEDIASALHIRPGTVAARLSRARSQLEGGLRRQGLVSSLVLLGSAPALSAAPALHAACGASIAQTTPTAVGSLTALSWKGWFFMQTHPIVSGLLAVGIFAGGGLAGSALLPAEETPQAPNVTVMEPENQTDDQSTILVGQPDELIFELSGGMLPGQSVAAVSLMSLRGDGRLQAGGVFFGPLDLGLQVLPDVLPVSEIDQAHLDAMFARARQGALPLISGPGSTDRMQGPSLLITTITARTAKGLEYREVPTAEPGLHIGTLTVDDRRSILAPLAAVDRLTYNRFARHLTDDQLKTIYDRATTSVRKTVRPTPLLLRTVAAPSLFDQSLEDFLESDEPDTVCAAANALIGMSERGMIESPALSDTMRQIIGTPRQGADGVWDTATVTRWALACEWAGHCGDAGFIDPLWQGFLTQDAAAAGEALLELARRGVGLEALREHLRSAWELKSLRGDTGRMTALSKLLPWLADDAMVEQLIALAPKPPWTAAEESHVANAIGSAGRPDTLAYLLQHLDAGGPTSVRFADLLLFYCRSWNEAERIQPVATQLMDVFGSEAVFATTWLWNQTEGDDIDAMLATAQGLVRSGQFLEVHKNRPAEPHDRVKRLYGSLIAEADTNKSVYRWTSIVQSFWPTIGPAPQRSATGRAQPEPKATEPPPGADSF